MTLERTVSGTSGGLRFGPCQWAARLDRGRGPLRLKLGARFGFLEQFRVLVHLAACTERVALSQLEFSERAWPTCWLYSLRQWLGRNGWARLLLLRASSPFWDHVGEWMARTEPKQLVLLDVGYVGDNDLPPFQGEKRVVFLAILAAARMVIWMMRKKGLYDDAKFSRRDLILFFRHQLRVKIRCDRKRLDRITFDKRWVNAASVVVRKGAMLETFFLPLPAHSVYG